jgi:hypothetical protein
LASRNGGGHQDQGRVDHRGQLGAAAKSVGELPAGGHGAEALGPPAQQQPRHIAEVVQGITDQGQRAKADANGQLQSGEAAVEQHTPAKGGRIAISMFVLDVAWQPLAAHRWMAHGLFLGQFCCAVCRSSWPRSHATRGHSLQNWAAY